MQALGGFEGFFRGNLSGNVTWQKVNIYASVYGSYGMDPNNCSSRTTDPAGQLIEEYLTNTRRRYYDIYPKIGVEYMPTPNVALGAHYAYDHSINRKVGMASIARPFINEYLVGDRLNRAFQPTHNLHLFYTHAFPAIKAHLSMDFGGFYSNLEAEQSQEGTIQSPWIRLLSPKDRNTGASGTITYKMDLPANFSLATGVASDYYSSVRPQQFFTLLDDQNPWALTQQRGTAPSGAWRASSPSWGISHREGYPQRRPAILAFPATN